MSRVKLSCIECNADFDVVHYMPGEAYNPSICAFCGAIIATETDELCLYEEDEYED